MLYEAAVDPEFREALLEDRERAIQARGLALQSSELAVLRMIPDVQLARAIDAVDVSQTNVERRTLLKTVAATTTAVVVLGGCGDDDKPVKVDTGVRPDDVGPLGGESTGIRPDAWVDFAPKDDAPKDAGPEDGVSSETAASYGMRPNG